MVDPARSDPEQPEDRFDAAARRFQEAAVRARDACYELMGTEAPPSDAPSFDLAPHGLEPLGDRLRWRVPLTGGRSVDVTAAPEHADVEDGRHWSEGFGDLYEPIGGLGEAAVWEPLSHTLHTHLEGWAVTATVDVTFGSELGEIDLAIIEAVARAALAAGPAHLATAPPPRPTGRRWRGRRG